MNSNQDISNLYSEMVYEGTSSHGKVSDVLKMLKQAEKSGLVRIEETKNGFMIKSNVDNSQHLVHKGDKAFHNLRRYLNGLQKIAA